MKTKTGLVALALAATMPVLLAGCGGAKNLSRTELIAKAEPLCKSAIQKVKSALASNVPKTSIVRLANEAAAYQQQVSAKLGKLTPPDSMTEDWKVIVTGFQTAGENLAKVARYYQAKELKAAAPAINAFSTAQHDRAVAANRNGLKECSEY